MMKASSLTIGLSLSLGIMLSVSTAFANAQDVPGQVCQMAVGSSGTVAYDTDGVRNNSTTQYLDVVCPIVLYSATGRSLYIGGTDQSGIANFSCTAYGWDTSLATVSMPSITITTGTYTNGTIGSFNIPDSVAKLVIKCTIPYNSNGNYSKISDFWIQN